MVNEVEDINGDATGGESVEPTNPAPTPPQGQPVGTGAAGFPGAPTVPQPAITPDAIRGPEPTTPPAGLGLGGSAPHQGPTDQGYWQSGWAATSQGWAPPRTATPTGGSSAGRTIGLLVLALLLLGAGIGIGHGLWNASSTAASSSPPVSPTPRLTVPNSPTSPKSPSPASGAPSDITAIASKVDPGLVDINTTLSYQGEQAAGTGMVLTSGGEVLTNNHVIDGATSISVTDVGSGQTYTATVLGYDATSDLAVLQLHNASGLKTVSIGDSATVSIGESVVGIGNAGGTGGTPSTAGGSITALNQSITASADGGNSEQLSGLIESNAGIEPGDSGGPLVNDNGQVLAIDTAASAGFEFQGNGGAYSIPIYGAITIAKQIDAGHGSATIHIGLTGFLGIQVEPVSGGLGGGGFGGGSFGGGSFGEGGSGGTATSGVGVAGVVTGDPADEAGISIGDIITSFAGTTVNSPSALTAALVSHHPGDKVQISWTDQTGQSHTATVTLASGPPA
jgi:S1-C subfamily serine protease